jgi:hypothetical protein
MQRIARGFVLVFAGLSLSTAGSSLAAQQGGPDPMLSATQSSSQPAYPATSVPPAPPPSRDVAPLPPPFPPMPSSRPSHRHVDMGEHHGRRSEHHASKASHRESARASRRHSHKAAGPSRRHRHEAARAAQPSPKVMRRCHRMSYTQIMRSSSCRELMRQDLAAPSHRHSARSHRQKVSVHRSHKVRQHHRAARHRGK